MMNSLNMNKSLLSAITTTVLFSLPVSALATVGGGQRIEMVGYEPTDKKVYLLRHFDDGRGRLPQLYYYDLKAKYPQPLVEVRSIYINPKTKKFDEYDDQDAFFTQKLHSIKQLTITLKPDYVSTTINVNSLTERKEKVTSWLEDMGELTQYKFNYKVLTGDGKYASSNQTATAYKVCLMDSGVIYRIPNQPYAVTTVSYTGTLMEGGYTFEDAVLLQREK